MSYWPPPPTNTAYSSYPTSYAPPAYTPGYPSYSVPSSAPSYSAPAYPAGYSSTSYAPSSAPPPSYSAAPPPDHKRDSAYPSTYPSASSYPSSYPSTPASYPDPPPRERSRSPYRPNPAPYYPPTPAAAYPSSYPPAPYGSYAPPPTYDRPPEPSRPTPPYSAAAGSTTTYRGTSTYYPPGSSAAQSSGGYSGGNSTGGRYDYGPPAGEPAAPEKRTEKANRKKGGQKGGSRDEEHKGKGKGKYGSKGGGHLQKVSVNEVLERQKYPDVKSRLHAIFQLHSDWTMVWVDGVSHMWDAITQPTSCLNIVVRNTKRGDDSIEFLVTHGKAGTRKKDREKGVAEELTRLLQKLHGNDPDCRLTWYSIDPPSAEELRAKKKQEWAARNVVKDEQNEAKEEEEPKFCMREKIEELQKMASTRCSKTVELSVHSEKFVYTNGVNWHHAHHRYGQNVEVNVLDKFAPGFAKKVAAAKEVNGRVGSYWYVVSVLYLIHPESEDGSVVQGTLGAGLSMDLQNSERMAVQNAHKFLHLIE